MARLRDRRDRDVRVLPHARHQHLRPDAVHTLAPRHAHRPRRLDAARDLGGDVHRSGLRRRERRDEPLRRGEPADDERRRARGARPGGRRPDVRREPHERLHRRPLAREHRPSARALLGHGARRDRGDRPLGLPLLHRGSAALGDAPGQRRGAADRCHPRGLPDPAAGAPRRRRPVRSGGPLSVPRRA